MEGMNSRDIYELELIRSGERTDRKLRKKESQERPRFGTEGPVMR